MYRTRWRCVVRFLVVRRTGVFVSCNLGTLPCMARLDFWNRTITDDRGVARPIDVGGWRKSPAWGDPRTRFALEEARRLARPQDRHAIVGELQAVWVIYIVYAFIGMIVVFVLVGPAGMPAWIVLPVAGTVFYFGHVMVWHRAVAVHRDRIVETLTGAGLCPGCAYDLTATEPVGGEGEEGGPSMVVCPECGGAWGAHRIREHAPVKGGGGPSPAFGQRVSLLYSMRRRTIRDDAGRDSFLQLRHPKEALRTMAPRVDRARWTRAQALVRRLGDVRRLVAGGFCALVGAVLLIDVVFRFSPVPSVWAVVDQILGVFMPALFLLLGLSILNGNVGMNRAEARRILLAHRLCPTCSDDLDEAARDEDGLRCCRTCGGRWRVPADGPPLPADGMSDLPRLGDVEPSRGG